MTTLREYTIRDVLTAMDKRTAWEADFDVGSAGVKCMTVFPPVAIADGAETAANVPTSGNVLTNDMQAQGAVVTEVNGKAANVGAAVAGSTGGLFTVNANGTWSFDPDGDFDALTAIETRKTSVLCTVGREGNETISVLDVTVGPIVAVLELFAATSANSGGDHGYDPYEVTLPAGLQAGDLVIVAGGCVPWSSSSDPVVGAVTSGYTRIKKLKSAYLSFAVDYKVMGSTPDTTVTVGGSDYEPYGDGVIILVYRGANTTTPIDVTATFTQVADVMSPGVPNNPSITPVTEGSLVVPIAAWVVAFPTVPSAPTGYSNLNYGSYDPGTAYVVTSALKEWSGSGDEDPAAWGNVTLSNWDEWAAVTIAIRPA